MTISDSSPDKSNLLRILPTTTSRGRPVSWKANPDGTADSRLMDPLTALSLRKTLDKIGGIRYELISSNQKCFVHVVRRERTSSTLREPDTAVHPPMDTKLENCVQQKHSHVSVKAEQAAAASLPTSKGEGSPPITFQASIVKSKDVLEAVEEQLKGIFDYYNRRMAERNGLTSHELNAMEKFVEEKRDIWCKKISEWRNNKPEEHGLKKEEIDLQFVVRHDQVGVYPDGTLMPPSDLARSLLVIPQEDGTVKVFVLLKQKGGIKTLSNAGAFKKATWALDLDTWERKVFLSEKREKYCAAKGHSLTDQEMEGLNVYAGIPGFSGGRVVKYRHKERIGNSASGKEKRGVLVDPMLGGDMSDYLSIDNKPPKRKETLTPEDIDSAALDISYALAVMSANGHIHLDLKPENILLDLGRRAKLSDYSLIHKVGALRRKLGTPAYRAPEIVLAKYAKVDGRADVWSFGMTLCNLRKGKEIDAAIGMGYHIDFPMPGRTFVEKDSKAALEKWKEANLPNRKQPGTLDSIIDRCLQFDPEDRMRPEDLLHAMAEMHPQTSFERLTEGWVSSQVSDQQGLTSKPMTKAEAEVAMQVSKTLNRPSFKIDAGNGNFVVWIGEPLESRRMEEMMKGWNKTSVDSEEWLKSIPMNHEEACYAITIGQRMKRSVRREETSDKKFIVLMGPLLEAGSFEDLTYGWSKQDSGILRGLQSHAVTEAEAENTMEACKKMNRPTQKRYVGGGMYTVWIGPPAGDAIVRAFEAVRKGDAHAVRDLFASLELPETKKAVIEHADQQGTTLLHLAVSSGNISTTKILLEEMGGHAAKDAVFRPSDHQGMTPFSLAIERADAEMIHILLEAIPPGNDVKIFLEIPDLDGRTPLQSAVIHGSSDTVKLLLDALGTAEEKKEAIQKTNASGQNLLYFAVMKGEITLIKILLEALATNEAKQVAIMSQTRDGMTALKFAQRMKYEKVIQVLKDSLK